MTPDIEAITLISSPCKHGPGSPGWVQTSWPSSVTFFDDADLISRLSLSAIKKTISESCPLKSKVRSGDLENI